jgi:hypothetical protein
MWPKPHARGRCHPANYWAAAQILLPDIDGSHAIAMPTEAAAFVRTPENPPLGLALTDMPTHRTGAAKKRIETKWQTYVHTVSLL